MLLLLTLGAETQQRPAPVFFQEDTAARSAAAGSPLEMALRHSRPLTLDVPGLALAAAPPEGRTGAAPLLLALFPNPAATTVTVAGAAPGAAVRVFDPLGRVVLAADADATGRAVLRWPAATLAAGVYLVRAGRASARLSVAP